MKKFVILLFAALPMLAAAQMTPEAVIANTPPLPTPEQWGKNGHTEAFLTKIEELRSALKKIVAATAENISEVDIRDVQAEQMEEIQQMSQRMDQAAKGMEMMGMLMQKLNLTEADIKKISKMDDKESEEFIMKKMQKAGLNPNDIAAMVNSIGLDTQPPANMPQIDANAIKASQEADMAYMEHMMLYEKKAAEWEDDANRRILIEYDKYMAARPKPIYGLDDVMTKSITKEQYDAQQQYLIQLEIEYNTAAYRIWTEVIHNCQGELKYLMQFATTSDAAKAKMPSVTGNAAFDALNKSGNNAAAVADLYLRITESEPNTYFP